MPMKTALGRGLGRLDAFLERNFLWLHLLPALVVFGIICDAVSVQLARLDPFVETFQFYDWAKPFYFPQKREEFLLYAVLVAASALCFVAACVLKRSRWRPAWLRSPASLLPDSPRLFRFYLYSVAALNLSFAFRLIVFRVLLWAALLIFGLYYCRAQVAPRLRLAEKRLGRSLGAGSFAWKLILALICAQFLWVFRPFLGGDLLMINEYWEIPESTWLATSGRWVDNTDFINRHRILGLHKYDIRRKDNEPLRPAARDMDLDAIAKRHGKEEMEFLAKNHFELGKQILDRWVIHHHDFLLAPLMGYALGRGLEAIHPQYGLLNILLLKAVLEKMGGINYQNYFRAWYAFWPVYYALYLATLIWLLKDLRYVLLAAVLAFACINSLGFDFLYLGPGLNPIRHIFDMPILACLALYCRGRSLPWLAVGFALSLAAILNNAQFGLFALLSLAAAAMFAGWEQTGALPAGEAALSLASLAAGAGLMRWEALGSGPLTKYYVNGFCGFPLEPSFFLIVLGALALGYGVLARFSVPKHGLRALAIFLFIYSQGMLVYYVWGATPPHLMNISAVLAAAGVCLFKLFMELGSAKKWQNLALSLSLAAALALLYAPAVLYFHHTKLVYERIFSDHKTYQWDFPAARFRSTMDPKYFEDAAALLRRYSGGSAVYMLSKYDSLLPFLAGKYTAMPFFHLADFLMTEAETRQCAELIRAEKPAYLFVDTDIDWDRSGDTLRLSYLPPFPDMHGFLTDAYRLIHQDDWLRHYDFSTPYIIPESRMRVARLKRLKDLFDRVRKGYALEERGELISVYKRKAGT